MEPSIIEVKNSKEKEDLMPLINQELSKLSKIKIKEMKNEYQKNEIRINNKFDEIVSSSLSIAVKNSSKMIWHLFDFNWRLKALNDNIRDNEMKYGYLSNFQKLLNKLDTSISLYKAKILSLFKSADKYNQGLKLLFDSHFATLIINILIKKYHSYFKKIKLDLNIAHELINYYQDDFEKNTAKIKKIKDELIYLNTKEFEEAKNNSEDMKKIGNEIKFIKDIYKNKINIDKTQLNFILELFFYTKKKGNQIGHPNIEPEKIIDLKNEEKGFGAIDEILNDINFLKMDYNLEDDLKKQINNKVQTNMNQIKTLILNFCVDLSVKKELNINQMLDFMFNGKISGIWVNQFALLRSMIIDIEQIIEEDCKVDLDNFRYNIKKLKEHKKIIDQFKDENIIENFSLDISTIEYENIKHLIKVEFDKAKKESMDCGIIDQLINIDYSNFSKKIFEIIVREKFSTIYTEHEYMEIINEIAIPFIIEIETKNYEILQNNYIKEFTETTIMENIKTKTEKIYKACEKYFKEEEINEDYIDKAKKFCSEKKNEDSNDIVNLEIDINSVIFYLKTLIGKENIMWLENDKKKERFSLNTLLYFYQNKLE